MLSRILLVATLMTGATGAASAQDVAPGTRSIVVVGRGEAEKKADYAALEFGFRGEGRTEVDALRAMTSKRSGIEAALSALQGARAVELNATSLSVTAVRSDGCGGEDDYDEKETLSTGKCAVTGFVASLAGSAKVSPAEEVGNAASLAAQLGAYNVKVGAGGILDASGLEDAALADAFRDAERQARAMAAGARVKLGPVIRVQNSTALYGFEEIDEMVVTARNTPLPAKAPQVSITMNGQPIKRTASVMVVYAIEP